MIIGAAPKMEHAFMRTCSEYLEQATKYDALAAQAIKERRKAEYARLAEVYRYFADEAAAMHGAADQPRHVA